MAIQVSTPGVYISEVTGPGVIQGVGTSTAAFVGPTGRGPAGTPTAVTTYDQFIATFGTTGPAAPHLVADGRLFHLSLAVLGFFENGGSRAYVVRTDNSVVGSLPLLNDDGATVAVVRADAPGHTPTVEVVRSSGQSFAVVGTTANVVSPPPGPSPIPGDTTHDLVLDDASGFRVGDDVVTDGAVTARITHIDGTWIRPSVALADHPTLHTAPLTAGGAGGTLRLDEPVAVLRPGSPVTLTNSVPQTARTTVVSIDGDRVRVAAPDVDLELAGRNPTMSIGGYTLASGTATITARAGTDLTVDDPSPFSPGDVVSDGTDTATVLTVAGNVVTVDTAPPGPTLTITDLSPTTDRFRVLSPQGLAPGMLVRLSSGADTAHAVISQVAGSGLVTLSSTPARTVTIAAGGTLEVLELSLIVTGGDGGPTEVFTGLSTSPTSASYWLTSISSDLVTVTAPDPPFLGTVEDQMPATIAPTQLPAGTVGTPATLGLADYVAALDALARIDEVSIVCAPDAASLPADTRTLVHDAMIRHCVKMADRIAVIDPPPGLTPSMENGVGMFRQAVQSERGFAALYYPWVLVLDPTQLPPLPPRRLAIPPSGHVAGVMARTDAKEGVFHAPAGQDKTLSGVLGVEWLVTDEEQGPLNLGGTNVLRILPGTAQVAVWGARTTVAPNVTDWMFVNVRRLLLFIEESIQEAVRWAVFAPNDRSLWKSLERVIRVFLRTQWRNGALFGATEDEAFRVRIDDGLNPPEVRNVGRLNIEIKVAPVRPAEFIVITIGLFDGGTEVEEA